MQIYEYLPDIRKYCFVKIASEEKCIFIENCVIYCKKYWEKHVCLEIDAYDRLSELHMLYLVNNLYCTIPSLFIATALSLTGDVTYFDLSSYLFFFYCLLYDIIIFITSREVYPNDTSQLMFFMEYIWSMGSLSHSCTISFPRLTK